MIDINFKLYLFFVVILGIGELMLDVLGEEILFYDLIELFFFVYCDFIGDLDDVLVKYDFG